MIKEGKGIAEACRQVVLEREKILWAKWAIEAEKKKLEAAKDS